MYTALCALCSSNGSVRASHMSIAEEAGVSRDTVIRELPKLEKAGLITLVSVIRRHAGLYKVRFPSDWPEKIVKAARHTLEKIEASKRIMPRGANAADRDEAAVRDANLDDADSW